MLILCTGEDSYRSLARARELESAFRMKFDMSGNSVTRVSSGKDGVEELLSLLSSASLFSPRRFFRSSDLVSSCPQIKRKALLQALSRDSDMTIVVSVESKPIKKSELDAFAALPNFHRYDYPELSHAEFLTWARGFAAAAGIQDTSAVTRIAERVNDNTWDFVQEFDKWRAGGILEKTEASVSIYDVTDRFLEGRRDRWSKLRLFDDASSVLSSALYLARSYVHVQSGDRNGIHPFVAGKLSKLPKEKAGLQYARLATAFLWSRTGIADAEESLTSLS
ncbi:MAG: hypothetical protein AMXMBFR16_00070 [Candidatus Uhrbacteria bacterium]|uniref:DNA polymerase III delta N-terminal domain-containing protein n=1 Tax=candidate division WWE3 bacterium TaxID=2053526 RepID=A0A928TQ93_UNCKA|nr:hypothetical protein [candidate division WWE3 bacterium]